VSYLVWYSTISSARFPASLWHRYLLCYNDVVGYIRRWVLLTVTFITLLEEPRKSQQHAQFLPTAITHQPVDWACIPIKAAPPTILAVVSTFSCRPQNATNQCNSISSIKPEKKNWLCQNLDFCLVDLLYLSGHSNSIPHGLPLLLLYSSCYNFFSPFMVNNVIWWLWQHACGVIDSYLLCISCPLESKESCTFQIGVRVVVDCFALHVHDSTEQLRLSIRCNCIETCNVYNLSHFVVEPWCVHTLWQCWHTLFRENCTSIFVLH
jgi:hypothetical protein